MKKIILAVALTGVFGLAQASPGNSGGGNGGCGNGQQTNGCGGTVPAAGGHGGTGIGVGVGIGQGGSGGDGGHGGSVLGSGNSANDNRNSNNNRNDNHNSNLNAQGQLQGQQQGQSQNASAKQGQSQSSRNNNDNQSNASNTNSNANSGNNSNQTVTVQGDSYEAARIPVSTAYAPNIMPTAVCMGSSSGGVQGASFGVSIGSSWTDDNCMLLEQVRTVAAVIGDRETAQEMMCDVAAYANARARTGKPCAGDVKPVLTATVTQPATKAEAAAGYAGNDPIVRKRLGLPPL